MNPTKTKNNNSIFKIYIHQGIYSNLFKELSGVLFIVFIIFILLQLPQDLNIKSKLNFNSIDDFLIILSFFIILCFSGIIVIFGRLIFFPCSYIQFTETGFFIIRSMKKKELWNGKIYMN